MNDDARALLRFFYDTKQAARWPSHGQAALQNAADVLGLPFDDALALADDLEREGLLTQDYLDFGYVITAAGEAVIQHD